MKLTGVPRLGKKFLINELSKNTDIFDMEKFALLEKIINKYLNIIFKLIGNVFYWLWPRKLLLPNKLRGNVLRSKKEVDENKKIFKNFWQQWFSSFHHIILNINQKIMGHILSFFLKFKHIKKEAFRPANLKIAFKNFLLVAWISFKQWVSLLSPLKVMGFVIVGSLFYFLGIEAYHSSKKIASGTVNNRTPASDLLDIENKRPLYYKLKQREFELYMIHFPVYAGGPNDLKSLVIDVSLLASNQYIKQYLLKHEHLLKDRLNMTIEPVLATFPLEDEGKAVIKEKIRFETNSLLKELQIEGEIEEVNLINVLSN